MIHVEWSMDDLMYVTSAHIEDLTIDLFGFWLERDWKHISEGLYSDPSPTNDKEAHFRRKLIPWSTDKPNVFNRTCEIQWAQIHAHSVLVEISGRGELVEQIKHWLYWRFGVPKDAPEEKPPTLNLVTVAPKQTGINGYSPENWIEVFEPIKLAEIVLPNYEAIGRMMGRSARTVKNKWNAYIAGELADSDDSSH